MEGCIHELPPSKRFKLLHKKQQQEDLLVKPSLPPKCLPAKKRIYSNKPCIQIRLPAKKRVWVPHPLFSLQEDEEQQPYRMEEIWEPEGVDISEEDDGVACAICNSTDGDDMDPIVFCDGCDLMVHASCYGNPLVRSIPEGEWFCLRCEREGKKGDFDCCLCPQKRGAVKPTSENSQWAHILCALLVLEVFFRDPDGKEGIDCSRVPAKRWGVACYLCGLNRGCCIECSQPKCGLGFHASCGLEKELCIEYKEIEGVGIVDGFFEDHTELWKKEALTGKFKIVPREKLYPERKASFGAAAAFSKAGSKAGFKKAEKPEAGCVFKKLQFNIEKKAGFIKSCLKKLFQTNSLAF